MAIKTVFEYEKYHNIGLAADTKPSGQTPLSTFYEYDTFLPYVTYDGTNWVIDTSGGGSGSKSAPFEVRVAKAIDASVGAYAALDVVNDDDCCTTATCWTFTGMARVAGGYGKLFSSTIFSETRNIPPRLTLVLYNAVPTGELMDNSKTNAPLPADRTKWVGTIEYPALTAKVWSGSIAVASPSTYGNLPLVYKCAAGSTSLYGILYTEDIFTQVATNDIEITHSGEHL